MGQKKFPPFQYATVKGDTISNNTLLNKSTLIVVGHISCPAMLFFIRDLQKAAIDSIQIILLLENTKDQVIAFNTADTNDIWSSQRLAFRIQEITYPTVTFCNKEKIHKKDNGAVVIKNQCNALKLKYHAFEAPKIYAINNEGRIIQIQTGWYLNLPDTQKAILDLFNSSGNKR